jgi:4-hydroxybenzoate polyprenyltransferase
MAPRLTDLAELVRAPAALSVPGDVVSGAAAAGCLGAGTPVVVAASVCLYWAGMAANDWADRRLDAAERPERPIPSGRVAPGVALGVAAGLTAAGLAFAAAAGRRSLAVAAPLAGAVWAYDLALKNTPAGPLAMAACRSLNVLLGAGAGAGAGAGTARRSAGPALAMGLHTYTVTALSRREVHGGRQSTVLATLAGTALVAAAAARPSSRHARPPRGRAPLRAGLAGWYALSYGRAQIGAAREPSAGRFRTAVGAGIMAMPSLQGALAVRSGAPLAGALVAAAAPVGRRLARRLSPT